MSTRYAKELAASRGLPSRVEAKGWLDDGTLIGWRGVAAIWLRGHGGYDIDVARYHVGQAREAREKAPKLP
jgi:hypothetical protein